jgi:hypothetical protein
MAPLNLFRRFKTLSASLLRGNWNSRSASTVGLVFVCCFLLVQLNERSPDRTRGFDPEHFDLNDYGSNDKLVGDNVVVRVA